MCQHIYYSQHDYFPICTLIIDVRLCVGVERMFKQLQCVTLRLVITVRTIVATILLLNVPRMWGLELTITFALHSEARLNQRRHHMLSVSADLLLLQLRCQRESITMTWLVQRGAGFGHNMDLLIEDDVCVCSLICLGLTGPRCWPDHQHPIHKRTHCLSCLDHDDNQAGRQVWCFGTWILVFPANVCLEFKTWSGWFGNTVMLWLCHQLDWIWRMIVIKHWFRIPESEEWPNRAVNDSALYTVQYSSQSYSDLNRHLCQIIFFRKFLGRPVPRGSGSGLTLSQQVSTG